MNQSFVLFDGECNLCNRMVQFIMQRSRSICFASLSSDFAHELLIDRYAEVISLNTLVLFENNTTYFKSDAVLRICNKMNGLWPLLKIFRIMPVSIRDKVYDLFANNRLKWFGISNKCLLPNNSNKAMFVR